MRGRSALRRDSAAGATFRRDPNPHNPQFFLLAADATITAPRGRRPDLTTAMHLQNPVPTATRRTNVGARLGLTGAAPPTPARGSKSPAQSVSFLYRAGLHHEGAGVTAEITEAYDTAFRGVEIACQVLELRLINN
jgi:hypothetical protein